MIRLTYCLLSLLVFSLTTASATEADVHWKLTDIDGKVHRPFEEESTRGLVLVFISTDCPIANGYQPLLGRLANEYEKDGIRFFMIHASTTRTVEEARKHASEFGITTPVVLDTDQSITRRTGATITPQAFVFTRNKKDPVYQGRIDNLYAGFGKKRNVATTHDLEEALEAVVAGRAVQETKTKAVGCYISYVE